MNPLGSNPKGGLTAELTPDKQEVKCEPDSGPSTSWPEPLSAEGASQFQGSPEKWAPSDWQLTLDPQRYGFFVKKKDGCQGPGTGVSVQKTIHYPFFGERSKPKVTACSPDMGVMASQDPRTMSASAMMARWAEIRAGFDRGPYYEPPDTPEEASGRFHLPRNMEVSARARKDGAHWTQRLVAWQSRGDPQHPAPVINIEATADGVARIQVFPPQARDQIDTTEVELNNGDIEPRSSIVAGPNTITIQSPALEAPVVYDLNDPLSVPNDNLFLPVPGLGGVGINLAPDPRESSRTTTKKIEVVNNNTPAYPWHATIEPGMISLKSGRDNQVTVRS